VDSYVIVDHRTWAECGDGDLMEGVASEACSLAGHLGLGKLTLLYDENHVTLDGPTTLSFTEEVAARFLAYGWHVVRLFDVDDFAAIDAAFAEAKAETERPSIILMHSHIGVGTPLHDDHRAHGSPVGPSYAGIARGLLGWPYHPFVIPREIYNHWRKQVNDRAVARPEWDRRLRPTGPTNLSSPPSSSGLSPASCPRDGARRCHASPQGHGFPPGWRPARPSTRWPP
jgi:transketolase